MSEIKTRDKPEAEDQLPAKIPKKDYQRFDDLASQVPSDWKEVLKLQFEQPYFRELIDNLNFYSKRGKVIYPTYPEIFKALECCSFAKTKVVIIGQDPYHGPNQAEGLCFSVKKGVAIPPSEDNIFKEMETDLAPDWKRPDHGSLLALTEQGILLLNSVLTVSAKEAASHSDLGWEQFTDAIIAELDKRRENLVFLLWGQYARMKGLKINKEKHLVLTAGHPSPLSAARFFGCRHFSQTNEYLKKHGITPVNWQT